MSKMFRWMWVLAGLMSHDLMAQTDGADFEQKAQALANRLHDQGVTNQDLDDLETAAQDLLRAVQNCEQSAEATLDQLVSIREIDSLQADGDSPSADQNVTSKAATEEVDSRINATSKQLIQCRLAAKQLEEVRQQAIIKKQDQWLGQLTQQQPVWNRSLATGSWSFQSLSGVFPINLGFVAAWGFSVLFYLLMIHRLQPFSNMSSKNDWPAVNLQKALWHLLMMHGLPFIIATVYYFLANTHKAHLLVMFMAVLARDLFLVLQLRMQLATKNKQPLHRFLWFSTPFIVLFSFGWDALFHETKPDAQWLIDHALFMTPYFYLVAMLLGATAVTFARLIQPEVDLFAPRMVLMLAVGAMLAYALSYANGAQYILIIASGILVVHWTFKASNTLRKVLLAKRIQTLKAHQDLQDTTFAFPFWISLLVSVVTGVGGFWFLCWLGGVSAEVFKQIKFVFNEGFDVGSVTLIPKDIILGVIIVLVMITILNKVKMGIQNRWLDKSRLRKSSREVFSMLVWYAGITVAVFMGLTFAGFDVSNLAIIAGALSVGIGFGLKNIVSNFVSGLILLFERPVTRGDWVEVDGTVGLIEKVKIRATRIRTFDNAEILVPNSELLSHHVTNWTLSNSIGRITLKVGVAYGSDVEKVRQVLDEVAKNHDQVVQREPYKHKVLFREFGDSSLNFELRVLIKDIKQFLDVETQLNFAIERGLREAGIVIPFPQRDIHIKSGALTCPEPDQKTNNDRAEGGSNERRQQPSSDSSDAEPSDKGEVEQMIEEDEKNAKTETNDQDDKQSKQTTKKDR